MKAFRKLLCIFNIHHFVETESMGVNGCRWYHRCEYCGKEKEKVNEEIY